MSSSDQPAVSVVMPAHNAETYVAEAVASVLNQTFRDLELVVVDDHSTDMTRQIVQSHADRDGRVRILDAPERGLVPALSYGISAARGALIARADADDRCAPARLEVQYTFLNDHADVGLLGSSVEVVDGSGDAVSVIRYPLTDTVIRMALRHEPTFAHGAVMMRRDSLEAAGGYRADAHPAEDYDLWCRMVASGVRAANLDAALYEYRVHGDQVTRTQAAEVAHQAAAVGARYGRMLTQRPHLSELFADVDAVAAMVEVGDAAPNALRRVTQSLRAASSSWLRQSPLTAFLCAAGAARAEWAFRRLGGLDMQGI